MRIEVCGGIGAGKTTIAEKLAQLLGYGLIRETYREVPFWKQFYEDPEGYSFEKNVSFALAHGDRLRGGLYLEQAISDFALLQDLAYAALSGDKDEMAAVTMVYRRMERLVGHPALLVRVQCRFDLQLQRIRQRGRPVEQLADETFINRLNCEVAEKARALVDGTAIRYVELDTTDWNVSATIDEWKSRLASILSVTAELSALPGTKRRKRAVTETPI